MTISDPHNHCFEWRVVRGTRQCRYNHYGIISGWFESVGDGEWLFDPTPERLTLWAELLLQ